MSVWPLPCLFPIYGHGVRIYMGTCRSQVTLYITEKSKRKDAWARGNGENIGFQNRVRIRGQEQEIKFDVCRWQSGTGHMHILNARSLTAYYATMHRATTALVILINTVSVVFVCNTTAFWYKLKTNSWVLKKMVLRSTLMQCCPMRCWTCPPYYYTSNRHYFVQFLLSISKIHKPSYIADLHNVTALCRASAFKQKRCFDPHGC